MWYYIVTLEIVFYIYIVTCSLCSVFLKVFIDASFCNVLLKDYLI